ncbi:MAG: tetratricopeptide repeat protein [Armatimonadetes bacterium]|nr:tetratricopeptide repeat protein [Armatimonadota bacterium]
MRKQNKPGPGGARVREVVPRWTVRARYHLITRERNSLERAIAVIPDREIRECLRNYNYSGDPRWLPRLPSIERQLEEQVKRLRQAGRREEAFMLHLYQLDLYARYVELFRLAPLSEQRRLLEAGRAHAARALEVCIRHGDRGCEAHYHHAYAVGAKELRDLETAAASCEKSVAILRELAEEQPSPYRAELASTLNTLGTILNELLRLDETVAVYEEALGIYRACAADDGEQYVPQVAVVLMNLGHCRTSRRELDVAVQAYEAALELYRPLAEAEPQIHMASIASATVSIANARRLDRDYEAAARAYEAGLVVYRNLDRMIPGLYRTEIAQALNNLGVTRRDRGELYAALQAFQESLAIRRALVAADMEGYKRDVARSLSNIGVVRRERDELELALPALREAIQLWQPLDRWLDAAETYANLGLLNRDRGRMRAAIASWEKAVACVERRLFELADLIRRDAFREWFEPGCQALLEYYESAPAASTRTHGRILELIGKLRQVVLPAGIVDRSGREEQDWQRFLDAAQQHVEKSAAKLQERASDTKDEGRTGRTKGEGEGRGPGGRRQEACRE